MSKRAIVIAVAALIVGGLVISTATEQAGLNRFDKQMRPILVEMHKVGSAAAKDASAVEEFHRKLPTWQAAVAAVKPPAGGYRAKLHQEISGFFTKFAEYSAKTPEKAHDSKIFEELGPTFQSYLDKLTRGPGDTGDDHSEHSEAPAK